MTYSEITLTFLQDFEIDQSLSFTSEVSGTNPYLVGYDFVFKQIRSQAYQISTGTPTLIDGERSAINFVIAFNLDCNFNNEYVVTRTDNVVVIKSMIHGMSFQELFDNDPDYITTELSNYSGGLFVINSIAFETASTDQCSLIKVKVTINQLAEEIISPITNPNNTANPIIFEWPRNQYFDLNLKNGNGFTIIQNFNLTPSFFDISNRVTNITYSPFGANLSINLNSAADLQIEYSLDNSTWQDSNVFPSLAPDNYTVYVRDQYGCNQNFDITISDNQINSPYFKISKCNSLRFANRIEWGDSANYKTDENTLSCEAFAKDETLRYKEFQLFQSSDVVVTQFLSNYTTHSVKVKKADLSEVAVPVIQKSNYIGNKEKRDAKVFSYASGKTGIYFVAGNIYDYTTSATTGTHNLNGSLPIWGKQGNFVLLDGTFYLIEEVIYSEELFSEVLVISNTYSGTAGATEIVGCIYNIFDYEIYEFSIDMVDYIDEIIQVELKAEHDTFGELLFLSESIDVQIKHEKTLDINYWNEYSDQDIIHYDTGIKHRIRVKYLKLIGKDPASSDSYSTDSTTILLQSKFQEGIEIEFEPQTLELHRKTKLALFHFFLFIDEVRCVIEGEPDVEQEQDTNLYTMKAKLLKAGAITNSDNALNTYASSNSEIPGLISTQSGFVKY